MKWLLCLIALVMVLLSTVAGLDNNDLELDHSGDGSGDGDIATILLRNPTIQLEEEEYVPVVVEQHMDRILWRDIFGDLRKESENARVANLLSYINTDGLPDGFRRLTSEYLSEMILLISKRLGASPFNRQLNQCTDRIPERFYHINYAAYDSLRHCPSCLAEIGVKYVNAVHDLVLDLFKCLDNHMRPAQSNYNNHGDQSGM